MDTTINASSAISISGAINTAFGAGRLYPTADKALVDATIEEELGKWSETSRREPFKTDGFADVAKLPRTLVHGDTFVEFLTLPTYHASIAKVA